MSLLLRRQGAWPGLDYPFPLSDGSLAWLRLPYEVKLSKADAERLGDYIASLVVEEDEAMV